MAYKTPPRYGDVIDREEFLESVRDGLFIDYDGYGYPMRDGLSDSSIIVYPSQVSTTFPADATHIEWFNR